MDAALLSHDTFTHCRTFACEVSATGQRVFLVSSAELFWQHYKALPGGERHHYEIIRQSSPCNLYFGKPQPSASNIQCRCDRARVWM